MLKTRIMTAAILLTVFLPMIFCTGMTHLLSMLVIGVLTLAAWEWARLLKLAPKLQISYAVLVGLLLVFFALAPWQIKGLLQDASPAFFGNEWWPILYWIAAFFWGAVVPFILLRKSTLAAGLWRGFLLLVGFVIFPVGWHALMAAHSVGPTFLISILLVVWLADSGAYFAGKRFGQHKLAPLISPGKTWEGVLGAWLLVLTSMAAVAGVSRVFDVLPFTAYVGSFSGWCGLLIILTLLVGVGVAGDLFESLMKRQAGLKDSSGLLPGHGGVLDRLDALLPMLTLAVGLYGGLVRLMPL
ncbi:phosphatidate cytidylyltransferase [Mycoavidus sp. B2-EB]|uniref:phosphatidate cytidylyltransferase n=1 Tax=Mycoavidus sp. B2-EB TaxID=2651972 RepID=UPI0016254AFF|nr:phosphatidate cytidylyltransferase [Mycoavidus sp. B2-EB]BBO59562.1 phosphatidate cytidylyltransferase [Mycoavidus sp. B2-EB]